MAKDKKHSKKDKKDIQQDNDILQVAFLEVPENQLDHLEYFDFPKAAKEFAKSGYAGLSKEMKSFSLEADDDRKPPLSYRIAEHIIENYSIYAVNDIGKLFVSYPGTSHYIAMDSARFTLFLSRVFHKHEVAPQLTASVKRSVFSYILTNPKRQILPEYFDAQERFINVANGVVDLVTGELQEHSHKYGFLSVLPFKYDEKYAKSDKIPPLFKDMLNKNFPEKDNRKRFLQCLAYLISNDCSRKAAFFWLGEAHTGKSTYQRLLTRIVGEENVSHIPLGKFSDRFAIANLFGKKLNMAGETEHASLRSVETFKALVGNDWLDAEFKGKDHFSFKGRTKCLFAGNQLPLLDDSCAEQAVFDRFEFIRFKNPIAKEKQIPFFDQQLLNEEGDKILSVLIRELRKLLINGCIFKESKSSEKLKKRFKRQNKCVDSVKIFLKDCCENSKEKSEGVSIRELVEAYEAECRENALPCLTRDKFIKKLLSYGPYERHKFHPDKNTQYRGIKGLRLKQS